MKHGSYLVRTFSGSTYWVELADESWVTRVPDDANPLGFAMRRDGEQLRILRVDQLEEGKPMGLILEHVEGDPEAFTVRVTSDVVAITPLPAG